MTDLPPWGVASDSPTAQHYRTFGAGEVAGSSATYEDWALGVAEDDEVLALIDELPRSKRQANLVFAAARVAGVLTVPWTGARRTFIQRWPRIRATASTRATQTNEAARCGVLLPALAGIPGPLALLEVGASAGLCLYPDRYGYRYRTADGHRHPLNPDPPSGVVIDCQIDGVAPPTSLPDVVWRAGIDVNPLDPRDPATVDWLDALIWPDHEDRRRRLRAAAAVAAADPAPILAGDLNELVADAAASAPSEATLVVFHTAVLAYLGPDERARFAATMARTDAVWISNEGVGVFPEIEARLPADVRHRFVLGLMGGPSHSRIRTGGATRRSDVTRRARPSAPSPGLGAPSPGLGAPSAGLGAPSAELRAPSAGLRAPSEGFRAPSAGLGAPSAGSSAPSAGLSAPSREGASDGIIGTVAGSATLARRGLPTTRPADAGRPASGTRRRHERKDRPWRPRRAPARASATSRRLR